MPDHPTQPGGAGGFTPPSPEELQALLPQYEILSILGIGGMGAVYKARQPRLERFVAIKVLPSEAGSGDFNFAERFQREAQAMAKLHHQRIVSVHDFGEAKREGAPPLLYIIMEFVEGTDLHQLIRSQALRPEQTLAVITQICDALHYAHERGIVHRDIKPANIMLDVEGNVKVADFGLAKLTGGDAAKKTQLTMTNMAMGTPDYVAPEQLEMGRDVDQRADIYSLGVMIYEMLTGSVPRGAFLPPSQRSTDPLDPRLDEVVIKAMQADPDTRYQQVSALWTDVDRIRTTPVPAARPALHTGKVPVMGGGTGKVRLVTGEGAKVTPKQPEPAPRKPPMDPAKKKKIITITLVSAVSALALGALAFLVLAPAPTKDRPALAADLSPTPPASGPRTSSGPATLPTPAPDAVRIEPSNPPKPPSPPAPATALAPVQSKVESARPAIESPQPQALPPLALPAGIPPGEIRKLGGHTGIIRDVAILPDNRRALSASADKTMRLWDLQTGEILRTFDHPGAVLSLAVFPGGNRALAGTTSNGIFFWDLDTGEKIREFTIAETGVEALAFTSNGNHFVAGTGDGMIHLFNTYEAEPLRKYEEHKGPVSSLAFLPDDKHFISAATGSQNPRAIVWSIDSDGPVRAFPAGDTEVHAKGIGALAVSADGKILLTGGATESNSIVHLWAIATEEWKGKAKEGHGSAGLSSLAFLPGHANRYALSSGQDKTIRVLNLQSMTEMHRFETASFATNHTAVSPDGRFALSGGGYSDSAGLERDGAYNLRLWRLPDLDPDASPPSPAPPSTTVTKAEPAAPPSPEPPRSEAAEKIAALSAEYSKKFADTLGKAHAESVARLNASYRGALERESKRIAAAGDLEAVLPFDNEMKALAALEAGEVLLAALSENAPASLQDMRAKYRETIAGYEKQRDAAAAPLLRALDQALEVLVANFTRASQIDDAVEVRAFRDRLKENGVSILTGEEGPDSTGWIDLFDGSSLEGWTLRGPANAFLVEDGALKATGAGRAYLYYTGDANGGSFKNFEFKATLKTGPDANSGIYFHTRPQHDAENPRKGHEVQIHNGDGDGRKTGSVYAIKDIDTAPAKDGERFDLEFRVEGNRVTVRVDGEVVNEYVEAESAKMPSGSEGKFLDEGTIAIQTIKGSVHFKEIRIRSLD